MEISIIYVIISKEVEIMRNIELIIEYMGKSFNGWQKQPDKLNIQGEIEEAIYEITGERVNLIASGRMQEFIV